MTENKAAIKLWFPLSTLGHNVQIFLLQFHLRYASQYLPDLNKLDLISKNYYYRIECYSIELARNHIIRTID